MKSIQLIRKRFVWFLQTIVLIVSLGIVPFACNKVKNDDKQIVAAILNLLGQNQVHINSGSMPLKFEGSISVAWQPFEGTVEILKKGETSNLSKSTTDKDGKMSTRFPISICNQQNEFVLRLTKEKQNAIEIPVSCRFRTGSIENFKSGIKITNSSLKLDVEIQSLRSPLEASKSKLFLDENGQDVCYYTAGKKVCTGIDFGDKNDYKHTGSDITYLLSADKNQNVYSIGTGVVTYSGFGTWPGSLGRRVEIQYNIRYTPIGSTEAITRDMYFTFAHLNDVSVAVGDNVTSNTIIGHMGRSGGSCKSKNDCTINETAWAIGHLHFEGHLYPHGLDENQMSNVFPSSCCGYTESDPDTIGYIDPSLLNPSERTVTTSAVPVSNLKLDKTTYKKGDTVVITWEKGSNIQNTNKGSLKRDTYSGSVEGADYKVITQATENNGTFSFVIPEGLSPANDWRFWIKDNQTGVAISSEKFIIEQSIVPVPPTPEAKSSYIWTKTMKGTEGLPFDYPPIVKMDVNGNKYITGKYQRTVNFREDIDGGIDNRTSKDSSNLSYDIFLIKINSDGSHAWIKTIGGNLWDKVTDIQIDSLGFLYIFGYFTGTVNFREGIDGGTDIKTGYAGKTTSFVTKISTTGVYSWTKILCGNTSNSDNYIVSGKVFNSEVYLFGNFSGSCNFGKDFKVSDTRSSQKDSTNQWYTPDTFLTKIDTNGNYISTKIFGGTTDDYPIELEISKNGHLFLLGKFRNGNLNFAKDFSSNDTKTAGSSGDSLFLVRINSNGTYGWTKVFPDGANLVMDNFRFAINSNEDIYIWGCNLYGAYNFGQIFGWSDVISSSKFHGTITKVSVNGGYIWTKKLGTRNSGANTGTIFVDTSDNIYVSDSFNGSYDFGEGFSVSDTRTVSKGISGFITKIKFDDTYQWTNIFGTEAYTYSNTQVETIFATNQYVFIGGIWSENITINFAKDFGGTDNKSSGNAGNNLFFTKFENK